MSASVDVLPQRPSLLHRRASNNFPDLPHRLSVSALFNSAALSQPGASTGPAAPAPRSGAPRKQSAPFLPFVPLTPIMASPLLTPDLAHAPTPAAVLDAAATHHVPGHDPPPKHEHDYLSHHHAPAPTPTWTTHPPTPPPKPPSSPRTASPSGPSSPIRTARGRSRSHSKSSRSRSSSTRVPPGPRPASLASYTPTPLSRSYSPSPSLSAAPSSSSTTPPATGFPARRMSLPADLSKPLPPRPGPELGAPKDLPPVPSPGSSASAVTDDADEQTLLPSLSRRAGSDAAQAQAASPRARVGGGSAGETGTLRGRARKLFSLADDECEGEGDQSDSEERGEKRGSVVEEGDSEGAKERERELELELERRRGLDMAAEAKARDLGQEKERAERVRRYHALMELLATEVGYLLDLRALVTVYLDQLLLLSSPPPAAPLGLPTPPLAQPLCLGVPLPASGRSMTSLSALFPSSRSSFFHHSPAPSPSPSTADFLAVVSNSAAAGGDQEVVEGNARDRERERTRQSSGASTSTESAARERDRERERERKSSRQHPCVLAEKEVRAVCRNARELLSFHERFVGELRAAVGLVGFGMVFSGDGEAWMQEMRGEGEGVVAELVERAVEVVATKFVNEAASFSIYETFCPGHAAATDLIRRAQERWPALWDAYEQRCTLLLTRSPDASASAHARGHSDHSAAASEEGQGQAREEVEEPLRKKRRHSTPALSLPAAMGATGPVVLPGPLPFPSTSTSNPASAATSPTTAATASPSERRPTGPRLKFIDYMIKPVQRICKYPLLLDQLRPKRRDAGADGEGAVDDAVRRAGEAMRGVVSRVNRASEKEAHNLRSALIASRIAFVHAPPFQRETSSVPSASPPQPQTQPPPTPASSSGSSSTHGHSSASTSLSPSSASSCTSSPATPLPTLSAASHPSASLPVSPSASSSVSCPLPPPIATAPSPRSTGLTAEFVSSLGPCTLAGALDVLQPPAHRAKYLGAFLYAGGYCVLAKVAKGGRAYEPRHWFGFAGAEVVDADEDAGPDDPSFPYSFHVLAHGHHLQIGASCAQEKALWLAAINDALAARPTWTNEPLSSFQADDKDKTPLSAPEDGLLESSSPAGLPAIQSMSELEKQADAGSLSGEAAATTAASTTATPGKGQLKYSRTLSRLDSFALRQDQHGSVGTFSAALSRRSSTASVKAFFSPFDSTRITRPSSQVRAQVDQGLHDIFSESLLAARQQAQMRGEELFQVRFPPSASGLGKRQGSGIPRSNSGISIANAMGLTAAKRRYDSVLVSRRKVSMEGVPDLPVPGENDGSGTETNVSRSAPSGPGVSGRAKTLAVRRHKKQPASIAPAITTAIAQLHAEADAQKNVRSPEALSLDSPPAASHCSSVSSHSHPGSMLPSPTEASPLPIPVPGLSPNGTLRQSDILHVRGENAKPKRARSMVSNVRSFFDRPRSDSPSVSSSSDHGRVSPVPPLLVDSPTSEYPSGIVQWLRRTSIRRRESGSSSSHSTDDHHQSSSRRPLPTRNSTDGVVHGSGGVGSAGAHAASLLISQGSRRVASDESSPKRRRSVFVPTARSRDRAHAPRDDARPVDLPSPAPSPSASASFNMPSRRSIKNIFLFQRSNSLTPIGGVATTRPPDTPA
ncbi:hypothetical protein OH77DRAFT_1540300 [Trametes cingulata]|nr:hypothetical protein OH77DRAFT_1540300 [Trametes cingulata]